MGFVLGFQAGRVDVCGELRGWALASVEGGSDYVVLVRPSELVSPCSVRRDVWLLRNGFRLSGGSVGRGRGYHDEVLGVFRAVVDSGWGGLRAVVESGVVRTHAGAWALGVAAAWLSTGGVPPMTVEPLLPSVLGFTRSKPDLVVGCSPVEVAYAPRGLRSRYARRKRVEVAAYALILEALLRFPVDYGWLVVITDEGVEVEDVLINNGLREEALRAREEVEEVIASSAPPPVPASCSPYCPFRSECLGAGQARGEGVEGVVSA